MNQPPISNQNVAPGCEKFKANAVVIKPIRGKFARFQKSEKVLAQSFDDGTYRVERIEWEGPQVPVMNVICGVPEKHLNFLHAN